MNLEIEEASKITMLRFVRVVLGEGSLINKVPTNPH